MKLEYAFLCDAGIALEETGLFSVVNGGVNVVHCSQFPGGLATIHLIARVSFDPQSECGRTFPVDIEIVGPAGEIIEPSFRNVPVVTEPSPLGTDRRCLMTLSFTFRTIVFPTTGVYSFRISHSDKFLGEVGRAVVDVIQK